jgi:hypothetical protein
MVVSEGITENNPLGTSRKEAAVLQLQVIYRSFSVAHTVYCNAFLVIKLTNTL